MRKFCYLVYKYGLPAIIFIIIVCGIIIRLKLILFNQSMWSDECSLYLNISQADYLGFFKPLNWLQVAPPIFMVIEKIIYDLFNNILPMEITPRLFPFFCSIVTLFIFPFFVDKVYKNRVITAVITFMTAFTPYVANYANEVKQYSCELCVSILMFMFFYFFDIRKISPTKLVIISFIVAMAPLLSFSSFFIIVAGSLIIFHNMYENRKVINFPILFLCYFIPLCITEFSIYFLQIKPIFDDKYLELLLYWSVTNPCMFTFSSFYGKFSSTIQELMGAFCNLDYAHWHIFFISSMLLLLLNKNKKLAILLLGSLAATIAASFVDVYPFDCRLILFLFPVFAIIYTQAFLFLDKKIFSVLIVAILLFGTVIAIKYPLDKYIIHDSKIREVFKDLQSVNPKLKNIIGPEGPLETYSGAYAVLGINVWENFDAKFFEEEMCALPNGTYYAYLPDNDDTNFNDDLKKMIMSSDNFSMMPIYSSNGKEYRNILKIYNYCKKEKTVGKDKN